MFLPGFRAAFVEKQLRSTKSVTLRDFNGKNVQTTRVNTVVRPNVHSQGPTWWDASQHPDTKMDWDDPALTPIVREKVIVDHYKQVSWKDVFAVGGHPHTPDDNVTAMLPLGVSKFEPSKLAHIESVVKAFAPWFHYIADTSPVGLQFDPIVPK